MSTRRDIPAGIKALLEPLVGNGDIEFLTVDTATLSEVERMLEEAIPNPPFALICYAGRDGGARGEVHNFAGRVSVFVGGINHASAEDRRHNVYDLLEATDGALMMQRIAPGYGPLINTGESLSVLTLEGVEVWEQVYTVTYSLG